MPKLNPTIVTPESLGDVAFDGVRSRPVVALNDDGELVVCCRTTARKHGWELQGTLHQRQRKNTGNGGGKNAGKGAKSTLRVANMAGNKLALDAGGNMVVVKAPRTGKEGQVTYGPAVHAEAAANETVRPSRASTGRRATDKAVAAVLASVEGLLEGKTK